MEMGRERESEMGSLEKQDCYFQLKVIPFSFFTLSPNCVKEVSFLVEHFKAEPYKNLQASRFCNFITAFSQQLQKEREIFNRAGMIFINTLKTSLLIMT